MKSQAHCLFLTCLLALMSIGPALAQSPNDAPSPTVSVFWVGVFVALFVGACVWFFIAMLRHERKTKAAAQKAN